MAKSSIDMLWVLVCASLVFLMQAGFLCLEAGSTRSKNNINVAVKNFTDFGVSVLCFWLFGYALMFGRSASGWVGTSQLLPDVGQGDGWLVVFFLFQVMFCGTSVTIVSGSVAERMRFSAYMVVTVLLSGLIYPIFGHWAWNGLDVGDSTGWLGQRGFVDFAGSTVVHSVGGWVSLAAVIVLGPRIGRFSRKRQRPLMPGYDLPLAVLGTMLLWFGWFGFNGGSVLALNARVPGVLANTVLAGSAGMVAPMLLNLPRGRRLPVSDVINGSLAGLVAITANCHIVHAPEAVLIGGTGALAMLMCDRILVSLRIDDAVGAIPVHLAAGVWGTLSVALFGDLDLLGTGLSRLGQLQVQAEGILAAGIWSFGLTYVILMLLNRWHPLRVTRKQEHIGLNISEHGAANDLVDLFTVMRRQEITGNLRLRAQVEPFTPGGQMAARYNRVIAALEAAIASTEAIVQNAIEAIVVVSKQTLTVRSVNPAVSKLFGLSEAQVCGQPITLLAGIGESDSPVSDLEPMRQWLSRASADGSPYELLGKRRSGSLFPLEATVAETQTRQDSCYTLILRDITLRKQAEEALQEAAAKDEKSRQLEQALKDLQQAQMQLVHSEKMSSLGQLVAGVAHEINNPVNFISGNLSYAEQYVSDLIKVIDAYHGEYPEASKELEFLLSEVDLPYVRTDLPKLLLSMRSGTERITDIVKALKDFSRLGGAELKAVDVHQGIDSTLTILDSRLRETANRPAIQVLRQYGELPLVECYASQLNQVFMNLLTNAIDALEEKATAHCDMADQSAQNGWMPQITLSTSVQGDTVRIQVADNGVGIPDEVQRRMLDPFFTTKPVGKGTGLGMAISYQIVVDRHQGQLKCISSPGRGTRFLVEIPLWQKTPMQQGIEAVG
ncbi:MAG TPA: ammonium transporter [Trichocoleus sp.]